MTNGLAGHNEHRQNRPDWTMPFDKGNISSVMTPYSGRLFLFVKFNAAIAATAIAPMAQMGAVK